MFKNKEDMYNDRQGMSLLFGLETYDMVCRSYVGDEMKAQGPITESDFHNGEYMNCNGEWCRVEDVIELLKLRGVIQ